MGVRVKVRTGQSSLSGDDILLRGHCRVQTGEGQKPLQESKQCIYLKYYVAYCTACFPVTKSGNKNKPLRIKEYKGGKV